MQRSEHLYFENNRALTSETLRLGKKNPQSPRVVTVFIGEALGH